MEHHSTKKLTVAKAWSKFLHLRHKTASTPEKFTSSPGPSISSSATVEFLPSDGSTDTEAMESLIAELFASVSSIKAAYAQFQLAQSPYDPESIQSSDLGIVAELRHLSELKHGFCTNNLVLKSPFQSQIHEHNNLLKTYEITHKKLDSDIDHKDLELISLSSELSQLNLRNRELEMMVFPGKTLASLDGLYLSGLNSMHFLCALRFTVKSIRNFVHLMVKHMIKSGWDLSDASKSIHPNIVLRNTEHRNFSFESFVCNVMFSDFHKKDFNMKSLGERATWERDKFFNEFISLKSINVENLIETNNKISSNGFKQFLQSKYLSLIYPKMELAFFDNHDQRDMVTQGFEFPNSNWFMSFAEMARRVWLLHCLFFSFEMETKASIFQVGTGTRFSEVYMESVVPMPDPPPYRKHKTVGFTVVPGFKIGRAVIQSRVYLSNSMQVPSHLSI